MTFQLCLVVCIVYLISANSLSASRSAAVLPYWMIVGLAYARLLDEIIPSSKLAFLCFLPSLAYAPVSPSALVASRISGEITMP